MLGSFILLSFVAFLLAMPVFGVSLTELIDFFNTGGLQQNLPMLKFFQTVQSIGMFVIPPFLVAWLYSRKPAAYLKLDQTPQLLSFIYVIGIIFFSIPLINYLSQLNQNIQFSEHLQGVEGWLQDKEETAQDLTTRFLKAETLPVLIWNVVMVGVLPAVGEELVFRGLVQRIFTRWTRNAHLGVFIAAFLFSAMHIQFYGLIPRFFLGVLFGYFLLWSGSIWLPILGHFINNSSAVIYYYYMDKQEVVQSQSYESMNLPVESVFISAGLIFLLGFLIYLNEQKLRHH